MRLVLGFDFETTGLVAETDRIIEVGAVLWDWDRGAPVEIFSRFCWHEDNGLEPEIPPFITKLTGIDGAILKQFSISTESALKLFISMSYAEGAVAMAHNAPFDVGFLNAERERLGIDRGLGCPVIDSRVDLPLDNDLHGSKKLVHLAASHGFLNPFAHRAIFDVLTMLKVASNYDLDEIIARSKSPLLELTAHVSFAQKDLAKKAGFQWNPDQKLWKMRLKECDVQAPVDTDWGFDVSVARV